MTLQIRRLGSGVPKVTKLMRAKLKFIVRFVLFQSPQYSLNMSTSKHQSFVYHFHNIHFMPPMPERFSLHKLTFIFSGVCLFSQSSRVLDGKERLLPIYKHVSLRRRWSVSAVLNVLPKQMISVAWELAGNTDSRGAPDLLNQLPGAGPSNLCFNRP